MALALVRAVCLIFYSIGPFSARVKDVELYV